MKKILLSLIIIALADPLLAGATTYTYVSPSGVSTYTTPATNLATPAYNLANPAFQNNSTTITGLPNPTANTTASNNPQANNTAVAGQLAGAVAASTVAHTTGNQAAALGAQSMLVNAESNVISNAVMSAMSPLINQAHP